MSKIKIKNFGPVKAGLSNDEWLDINKVTVFIGNQGSGKSTVAKVISTLTWLEKALNRGDIKSNLSKDDFFELFKYQRINNYFKVDTLIEYEGEILSFKFDNRRSTLKLKEKLNSTYIVPKIMYVPAERNFLSVIDNPYSIKALPETLRTFAEELRKGQLEFSNKQLLLPIGNVKYEYNNNKDSSYLTGDNYEVNMLEASSGYQSFVPLFLVTKFLSDGLKPMKDKDIKNLLSIEQNVRRDKEISEINRIQSLQEEKDKKIEAINTRYINSCFVNIVEEPEQNLFPTSQWKLLQNLLEYNNHRVGNKLILTTHSPYLISYLTLLVKAGTLKSRIQTEDLKQELEKIVSLNSTIKSDDLSIYELDENNGTIHALETYNGLPSDENKLNEKLEEGNELFAQLLEIQKRL